MFFEPYNVEKGVIKSIYFDLNNFDKELGIRIKESMRALAKIEDEKIIINSTISPDELILLNKNFNKILFTYVEKVLSGYLKINAALY